MHKGILFGFLLPTSLLTAQAVVRSGYTGPAPVSVAPGQIATFYVAGLRALTGITATLQQDVSTPAPVQSVSSVSLCPDVTGTPVTGCATQTAVTIQIPYELVTPCPVCERPIGAALATLLISQNGTALGAIELNPVGDEVHVLTACDIALGQSSSPPLPSLNGLPCAPLVTHPNGSLVSASSPANVGEALTAWVFGLGQTTPAATTGQPATMASASETFNLDFNYQVNALPAKPFTGEPDRVPLVPLFAGLAPGFVGLYQVNFTVPAQPPNGTPQCALPGTAGPGANMAQSNLTVSMGGQFSFDGAGICVATQIPVD